MMHHSITIAGIGRSGMSVMKYLSSFGVPYQCCDDKNVLYKNCVDMAESPGYMIKSPGIPAKSLPASIPCQIINDIELFLRICKKPVVMVTGTNGKSTVVALLEHMFRSCGVDAIACGNNGVPVLQAYDKKPGLYILELSSYQLEDIVSFHSVSSVVLNIGVDHVDRYQSMAEYESVKKKVYSSSVVSVFPVNEQDAISYDGDISGYVAMSSTDKVSYSLASGSIFRNGEFYCRTSAVGLQGRHNYINVCAGLALLDVFGFEKDRLIGSLISFNGLPHRMELVCKDRYGCVWINDSKSTSVHSLRAALSSQISPVCLIMGGRGKGESYSHILEEYSHIIGKLIVYGEDAGLIISQAVTILDCVRVNTVSDAVAEASQARRNVLFSPACASFDQYRDFVERGNDFKQQVSMVMSC